MQFWEKVRKNLVLALALIVALSSFGGVPALAWVHADGSLCLTCPLDEPAPVATQVKPLDEAAPVDECCPSEESEAVEAQATVSALDCQVCCEAEGHEQSHRKVLPAAVAVLSPPPTMAQVFCVQAATLPTQRSLARKTVPYSLPSLRAPPV